MKSTAIALCVSLMTCLIGNANAEELRNDRALVEYGNMLAINEGCKADGADHSAKIEELLERRRQIGEKVLQTPTIPADAKNELAHELDRMTKKDYDKKAYETQRSAALKLNPQDRKAACKDLQELVESQLALLQVMQPMFDMYTHFPADPAKPATPSIEQ